MNGTTHPTIAQSFAKMQPGDRTLPVRLRSLEGRWFDLDSLKGKPYLLSFNRFAGCPFCNLRVHELVSRYHELGEDFQIVAIFDSPLDNLRQYADRHQAPFPILADPLRDAYVRYGIDHSLLGVLKGIVMRMHTLLYAMLAKGYWPFTLKGSIASMPADFLVDRQGIVRVAHYGSDEGDHLPFDEIKHFAKRTAE